MNELKYPNYEKNSLVIHSVFILQENILFLDEWIEHHIKMGVDHFVLYDNSKVEILSEFDKTHYSEDQTPGKISKHGIDFTKLISKKEAVQNLEEIVKKT